MKRRVHRTGYQELREISKVNYYPKYEGLLLKLMNYSFRKSARYR